MELAIFQRAEVRLGRGAPGFGVRGRPADRGRRGHRSCTRCRGRAAQRQLPLHAAVQLQLWLLLSHGQDVVRTAAGRGQARSDHAGGSRYEEAELFGRRTVRPGRRPVHGRADPLLQNGTPVGRYQRVDSEQRKSDPGEVDAPVRRVRGHAGRVVRLVRRRHEPDDRPTAGQSDRPRVQALRGARVVRTAQDRVQDQHGGQHVQRERNVRRAHRTVAARPLEGVPVPPAGGRERGRGRVARRFPVLRHRRTVRRVLAPARPGPDPGAGEQRRHAGQLPDPGRVHAVPELPQRQEGTVRVPARRRRPARAPRFRFRRKGFPGPGRHLRVE